MKKYDERDINDLTIAVFEAMNGTLVNQIKNGFMSDNAVMDFLEDYQSNLFTLLQDNSMGISTGNKAEGMELTLENLRIPGFNCIKQMLEQINNG